jgi:hypothetical protein
LWKSIFKIADINAEFQNSKDDFHKLSLSVGIAFFAKSIVWRKSIIYNKEKEEGMAEFLP